MVRAAVYRTWGKLRLSQLQGWVKGWAPDSVFAGLKLRGAQDAWYEMAARTEALRAEGKQFAVSA
eukprot:8981350-Alexandrium_andersonii.AAC.1